jgi:hypothetical protein
MCGRISFPSARKNRMIDSENKVAGDYTDVTGEWRKMDKEELHNLLYS